jgi:hypothetical protein
MKILVPRLTTSAIERSSLPTALPRWSPSKTMIGPLVAIVEMPVVHCCSLTTVAYKKSMEARCLECGALGFQVFEAALTNKATNPRTGWYGMLGCRPN